MSELTEQEILAKARLKLAWTGNVVKHLAKIGVVVE